MTRSLTALKHLNHWNKCPYWNGWKRLVSLNDLNGASRLNDLNGLNLILLICSSLPCSVGNPE